MHLSHEPFVVLYAIIPFILRKDLHASLLQISILTTLRPILPVFSFYWSAYLTVRQISLRTNLIGAWAFARIPFLFVPWMENAWYLIFCCGVYELFNRSGLPALMEILKINIPKETREKSFTLSFVLSFAESILLGFLMGKFLDRHSAYWPYLCGAAALIGLTSIIFQLRVPIPRQSILPIDGKKNSFRQSAIQPWKDALNLLQKERDFAHFQYGFMIGGISLMLVAPSLSIYYVDQLHLNHSDVVTGRSILMGFGIISSSFIWRRFLARQNVPSLVRWILTGFSLYLFSMILSSIHIFWFYASCFCYGIAQAGSHLLWNLSGMLFSGSEDSSPYTRVNILMVGIRGAIAPAMGGLLCDYFGPIPVLMIGGAICLSGVGYMVKGYEPIRNVGQKI